MTAFRDIFKQLFVDGVRSSTSTPISDPMNTSPTAANKQEPMLSSVTVRIAEPAALASTQQSQSFSFALPRSKKLSRLAEPAVIARARECLTRLGERPTEAQWRMILSPTVSTSVIAGAGSGKSTTLILRILVMHKLLDISLDELHVFSFTRASTWEFQRKLEGKLIFWEVKIEGKSVSDERKQELAEQVKRTVSTFHSVIVRLCRDVLPGGGLNRKFFDMIGSRDSDLEIEQGSYNPFVNINISQDQAEILNAAHTHAYQNDATYRALMQGILAEQERQYWLRAAKDPDAEQAMEERKWWAFLFQEQRYHGFVKQDRSHIYNPEPRFRDQKNMPYIDPYRAAIANQLYDWNEPFTSLVPFWIRSPLVELKPGEMRAAFKVRTNLFIHVHRSDLSGGRLQEQDRSTYFHERDRRRFMALYLMEDQSTDQHKVFTPADFEREGGTPDGRLVLTSHGMFKLQSCVNLQENALATTAPVFRVKLPGDLRSQHIAELFYQEGMFIESLGLDVQHFQMLGRQLDPISHAIAMALPLFWQSFSQELERRDLVRFHDVLSGLRSKETLHKLRDKLKHLQHLFIDEFQDISPEFVDWLSKTLAVHIETEADVSITAIGDDYQSIYGWRGSHPTFLMNFDRYFPTAQTDQSGKVVLEENFRSRQPIIDAAEAILTPILETRKVAKHGKSISAPIEKNLPHPVQLVENSLAWSRQEAEKGLWQTFSLYVATLLHDLQMSGHLTQLRRGMERRPLEVYILARTNATLDAIPIRKEQLRNQLLSTLRQQKNTAITDVRLHGWTFHKAKGLEADVVLLLDDALPPDEHPLRELVFRQATFLCQDVGTYAQAMNDEARRIAYVALTRARLGAMWVPLVQSASGNQTASNGYEARISEKGCFVLVKKHLEEIEQKKW